MVSDLSGLWYTHLDTNIYLATIVIILTGMGFAISLSVRSLIQQLACKLMLAMSI